MQLDLTGYTQDEVKLYILAGLQRDLVDLEAKIAELQGKLGKVTSRKRSAAKPAVESTPKTDKPAKKTGKVRVLSPEARERIAAAQRKRWAHKRTAKKRGVRMELVEDAG